MVLRVMEKKAATFLDFIKKNLIIPIIEMIERIQYTLTSVTLCNLMNSTY